MASTDLEPNTADVITEADVREKFIEKVNEMASRFFLKTDHLYTIFREIAVTDETTIRLMLLDNLKHEENVMGMIIHASSDLGLKLHDTSLTVLTEALGQIFRSTNPGKIPVFNLWPQITIQVFQGLSAADRIHSVTTFPESCTVSLFTADPKAEIKFNAILREAFKDRSFIDSDLSKPALKCPFDIHFTIFVPRSDLEDPALQPWIDFLSIMSFEMLQSDDEFTGYRFSALAIATVKQYLWLRNTCFVFDF